MKAGGVFTRWFFLQAFFVFGISTKLYGDPLTGRFGDRAIGSVRTGAASVLKMSSELSYDLAVVFSPSLRCPAISNSKQSPEKINTRALTTVPEVKGGDNPSEGDLLGALAEANVSSIDCDLQQAKAMQSKGKDYWRNFEKTLDQIKALTDRLKIAGRHLDGDPSLKLGGHSLPDADKKRLNEMNDSVLELETVRDHWVSTIPLSGNPMVSKFLNKFLGKTALGFDDVLEPKRLMELLKKAYRNIDDDLQLDRKRMLHAKNRSGEGLTSNDKNVLVKDPFLFSQISEKFDHDQDLKAKMCALNRSYGRGEDFFIGGLQIAALGSGVLAGGAGLLINSSRFALLAQRSSGAISLHKMRTLAHSLGNAGTGTGMASGAGTIMKCIQESPDWIGKGESGSMKICQDETSLKYSGSHDCIVAALTLGFGRVANNLGRSRMARELDGTHETMTRIRAGYADLLHNAGEHEAEAIALIMQAELKGIARDNIRATITKSKAQCATK